MTPPGHTDQDRRSDMAWLLQTEFASWYGELGAKGKMPRAFTGVTDAGRQAVVIISDSLFDHVQRREFLIWLCREERIWAYVYGTPVTVAEADDTFVDRLDFYASSSRFDMSSTFAIHCEDDGRIAYEVVHSSLTAAGDDDRNTIFHGLQRTDREITADASQQYSRVWAWLKPHCLWLDRPDAARH